MMLLRTILPGHTFIHVVCPQQTLLLVLKAYIFFHTFGPVHPCLQCFPSVVPSNT